MLEITPALHSSRKEPLYIQLYEYIRNEIQSGKIPHLSKLPSQRKLAEHLKVSRNTVDAAYQQLLAEGYIQSKARKGLFVVELNNELFLRSNKNALMIESRSTDNKQLPTIQYDFKHGDIDLTHFPYEVWRKLTMQSLYSDHSHLFLYGDPQGEISLRKLIAEYLYQSRGAQCSAEQIVIGAGTQYLISLLCCMIGRQLSYGLEEPGFHRIRFVLKDYGAEIKPIPLDEKGMSIAELRKSGAKVAYVTPSHQFPLGTVMPISRRMELIEWARQENGFIIEDDYDGEFRYQGKPIPSLQGLDNHGNVIYMGTFSKSLIPSIRLSYLVLPPSLLALYKEKFSVYKQTVSRLHQHTLKLFMENGHWERHINRIRNIYKKRHAVLLTAIKNIMGEQVHVIGAETGLHVLLKPNNNMSEVELIESARKQGVQVYPVSIYYEDPPVAQKSMVLLGFAGLDENEIYEGITLLHRAWFYKE
ncbi:PLP-dependent aminotransferase family protein [Bacillus sp. 03113]|uniref:MocR-like pyridoxine biosynthesis transcription factor PdxR n=1 Tax=Bacillus sp. 03113 TaxID=2578211 RepID=UPI0011433C57|nr:PLP-dependent aminotransferase family protein [Bacillus sp. 03113]